MNIALADHASNSEYRAMSRHTMKYCEADEWRPNDIYMAEKNRKKMIIQVMKWLMLFRPETARRPLK